MAKTLIFPTQSREKSLLVSGAPTKLQSPPTSRGTYVPEDLPTLSRLPSRAPTTSPTA